jgi:hypothetical protein
MPIAASVAEAAPPSTSPPPAGSWRCAHAPSACLFECRPLATAARPEARVKLNERGMVLRPSRLAITKA